jgi:hypothetical protein
LEVFIWLEESFHGKGIDETVGDEEEEDVLGGRTRGLMHGATRRIRCRHDQDFEDF